MIQFLTYTLNKEATGWASLTFVGDNDYTVHDFSYVGHDLYGLFEIAADIITAWNGFSDYLKFDHEGLITVVTFKVVDDILAVTIFPKAVLNPENGLSDDDFANNNPYSDLSELECIEAGNKPAFAETVNPLEFARMVLNGGLKVVEEYGYDGYERQYRAPFPKKQMNRLMKAISERMPSAGSG